MKKTKAFSVISILILAILLIAPFSAIDVRASESDDSDYYVYDEPWILDDDEFNNLYAKAKRISETYDLGIYIIIVNDYSDYGSSVESAADNIYYENNFGYEPTKEGGDREGLLLLLSMAERDYDINAHGYKGNRAFSQYAKDHLADSFLPEFRDDNWYAGLSNYLSTADELLRMEESGTPYQKDNSSTIIVLAILIFGVGGLIGAGLNIKSLKKKLKSVEIASSASNYIDGQLNLDVSVDRYTHTTRRVVRDSKKSSGGGGGGGSSHRSGKF